MYGDPFDCNGDTLASICEEVGTAPAVQLT